MSSKLPRCTEGDTDDGVAVLVVHADHYYDDEVFVDGQRMAVERASRRRDGGTTSYITEGGPKLKQSVKVTNTLE